MTPVSALSSAHLSSLQWQAADLTLARSIPSISVLFLIAFNTETGVSEMTSRDFSEVTTAAGEFEEQSVFEESEARKDGVSP